MTYHELVQKVQLALAVVDASKVEEHIAVQINVTGEAEGAFYMEISGGVLYVAPYDYNDRDALLTISGEDILAVAEGTLTMEQAYEEGRLQLELSHENSLAKLLALGAVIKEAKARAEAEAAAKAAAEAAAKAEEEAKAQAEAAAPAAEALPEAASSEKAKRSKKPAEKKPVAEKKASSERKSKTRKSSK